MDLQLKRIRESRKIKQSDMARRVSLLMGKEVKVRTYGSWERQEVTMDLEQAYYCALALDCTIDEIAGMAEKPRAYSDPRQEKMNNHFNEMNEIGKSKAAGSIEDIHANPANLKSAMQNNPVSGSQTIVA